MIQSVKTYKLKQAWRLLRPYWVSEERWVARGLFALVFALDLGRIYTAVLISYWQKNFYDCLTAYQTERFWPLLLQFLAIVGAIIVINTARTWFYQMLEMQWRAWITDVFVKRWLEGKAYHQLERRGRTDNPDQCIAEDLRLMASGALNLSLGFIKDLVNLVSYSIIIWSISGTLSFALGGHAFQIPGYMLWAAVAYAVATTLVLEKLGRRMVGIDYQQQQCEADFRFLLVRIRENAEQIAFYAGDATEQLRLKAVFGAIKNNWRQLMVYTKRVTLINSVYIEVGAFLPYLIIGPRYFAHAITFGTLMQLNLGFSNVRSALSWFIFQYKELATLRSVLQRLTEFDSALKQTSTPNGIDLVATARTELRTRELSLCLPDGSPLTRIGSLTISAGSRWLVRGSSGAGKSTFLRAIAGLWSHGSGRIERPGGRLMFLPQESYLPLGTLKAALCYPQVPDTVDDKLCRRSLEGCGLGLYCDALEEEADWSKRLSPGERQRLAFARVLLYRPDFLFLDEATSSLNKDAERALFSLLLEELPGAAVVSVAHRETPVPSFLQVLEICPADRDSHASRFVALTRTAGEIYPGIPS